MFNKMGDMMKQMKELKKAQKELKSITATIEKDNMKVTVNGEMKIVDITIPALDKKVQQQLKDMINEAMRKVQMDSAKALSGFAGGLNIPGLG